MYSTLSDESDGAREEVAPEDPLLVIGIVSYTLTALVLTAAL